ncbi:zinc finger protein ZAT7-like [Impatiens glandulifera]|uniref:zinc finger protein ZAT7-like n=1 Tax=Impatiens glandulifera TaxID=253017 RepID=UPI001FB147EC|nr:zinc finger protein ZAT7-like [Impatiens glandulifera]
MATNYHQLDMAEVQIEPEYRIFKCKTCNRQFSSFQALGGHRSASHKNKLRLSVHDYSTGQQLSTKQKTHDCYLCGLKFSLGQALGGHMRRHRAFTLPENEPTLSLSISPLIGPVLNRKSNGCSRICMLDLNLTL